MKSKYSGTESRKGMVKGIGAGVAVGLLLCVILASALAWLVVGEKVNENAILWGKFLILPLSAWIGSRTSYAVLRKDRLVVTGLHGVCYFLLLMLMGLALGDDLTSVWINALLIAAGGGINLIPAFVGSGSGGKKYKKAPFR